MPAISTQPAPVRLEWQQAVVTRIVSETYRAKTFTLQLPNWQPFRAGQHYDVRLTAPDGYQAQRSYSVASAPETTESIDLTIEIIPDGEVSPYFHQVIEPGDAVEVRGPIGGPFTWDTSIGGPLLLVGGGSGIVPLMSMLRHKLAGAPQVEALLLYSARSLEDVIYRAALEEAVHADPNVAVEITLTRSQPPGWKGYSRRIDRPMLEELLQRWSHPPHSYVCGPTPFVETVADSLVAGGVPPALVRTERFGRSGGS